MDGLEAVLTRRSIRKYLEKPVEPEKLELLLKAGMFAPSAKNGQPWEFVVVRRRQVLWELSRMRHWEMLCEAPVAIALLANMRDYQGSSPEFFAQDISAATQNILIAAHALGLGGVWLGLYPKEEKMAKVRELLNIPEEIIPFSIVSLGYPAEERHPHSTFRAEKVHWEQY